MRILYSPQRHDDVIEYVFENDIIHATHNGQTDTFDFSQMPDGEATSIETTLPVNPILSARRVDGVLEVVLLKWIGPDASEEERFPKWQEV